MAKTRRVPQRMCIGCQEMKGKKELIRIVRTPDDQVLLDPTGKRSGRGAYVCPQAACLEKALKEKALSRALQREIDAAVISQLQSQLTERDE